VYNTTN
ncbi:Speckle-type POZ protein, partial [Araneus ventricosus]